MLAYNKRAQHRLHIQRNSLGSSQHGIMYLHRTPELMFAGNSTRVSFRKRLGYPSNDARLTQHSSPSLTSLTLAFVLGRCWLYTFVFRLLFWFCFRILFGGHLELLVLEASKKRTLQPTKPLKRLSHVLNVSAIVASATVDAH